MLVKYKFLNSYLLVGKKILIIGTFNHDVPCNKPEYKNKLELMTQYFEKN